MGDLISRLVRLWARLFGGTSPATGAAPPPELVTFLATASATVHAAIDDEHAAFVAKMNAETARLAAEFALDAEIAAAQDAAELHAARTLEATIAAAERAALEQSLRDQAMAEQVQTSARHAAAAQRRADDAKARTSTMLDPATVMADGGPTPASALVALNQPARLADANARAELDAYTEAATRDARTKAALLGDEWGLMWVAHRDCCVNCLAYSGLVIAHDDHFDGGLSFRASNRDRFADAIPGPPLHPNDRCHLEVVHIASSDAASSALKREALRSGVLGWSLASESDKARREAAQELLHRQLRLPKSVLDRAHKKLGAAGPFQSPVPPVG